MPVIDTELIQPLTTITDTLLKRPGIVTMQSIKRLSEMYGFTTFVEFIKNTNINNGNTATSIVNTPNNNTNTNMLRLSISGMILLIDIDFEIPIEMQIGSPLSPTVNNPYIGIPLSNSNIKGVSISSAITPDLIDNKNYDFLFGFNDFSSCSDILFNNLKEKTLDSFNMNLRVLLLLDRLSKNKPNDLFTMFSELVWGLSKQNENVRKIEINNGNNSNGIENDWNDGIKGIGKVLANQDNKVGIFLQYWIDDRYINRWVKENKQLDVIDSVYKIHFKVKESLNYNKHSLEKENAIDENKDKDKEGNIDDNKGNNTNEENINENQINDKDGDIKMNESNNSLDSNINTDSNDVNNEEHLFNVKENKWRDDKKSDFSLITFELCPPIWIPEDSVLIEGMEYDIINEDNENWSDNNHLKNDVEKRKETIKEEEKQKEDEKRKQNQEQDSRQYDGENLLDEIYKNINLSKGNGCIELKSDFSDNDTKYNNIKLSILTGCKMIKLFKVQIGNMNKLADFVNILRNWCKLNNILRRTLEGYRVVENTTNDDTDIITLDDVFTTETKPPQNDDDNNAITINVTVNDNFHVINLDFGAAHVTLCDGLCSLTNKKNNHSILSEMKTKEEWKSQSVEITESLLTI